MRETILTIVKSRKEALKFGRYQSASAHNVKIKILSFKNIYKDDLLFRSLSFLQRNISHNSDNTNFQFKYKGN